MAERRARGTSPAGRGRTSRAPSRRPAAEVHGGAERVRRSTRSQKAGAAGGRDWSERTILGLSAGKAIILAMVVCALAMTLAVPMRTFFTQRAEAAQLAAERRVLADDIARLKDRRAQQQDPAYIRSEARDRLRLVMPGETPYIVQVPGMEVPAIPDPQAPEDEPDPWYTDLWRSISEPPPAEPEQPAPQPEGPR
ncbi:septum formation initiator family protein [Nocardia sp. NPDC051750]|uniref:septum formation initiator family protein n=1 Tax=Nocardia sp. NPDC051750 TaxID=3364325 RepID=UPI00378FBA28